jgi:hypothetical protein
MDMLVSIVILAASLFLSGFAVYALRDLER